MRGFRTTHWTVIRAAGKKDHAARDKLCRDYWYPVYAYVRRQGYTGEAADLTQDFFAYILQRPWLSQADPEQGRFRAFLLGTLHHFLGDAEARRCATKRAGFYPHVGLDVDDAATQYAGTNSPGATAHTAYEIEWATAVVGHALRRLENECAEAGKQNHFGLLKVYLKSEGDAAGYQAVADTLQTSVGNVKVKIHRLRQRYGILLREEVARTVGGAEEVDGEMRHLRAVFSMVPTPR